MPFILPSSGGGTPSAGSVGPTELAGTVAGDGLTGGAGAALAVVAGDTSLTVAADSVVVNTAVIATRAYVEATAQGLNIKAAVRVRAQGNITLSGPGATVDGIAMVSGDRFLADQQSTGTQDGIYVWNGAASAATRATDMAAGAHAKGAFTFVSEGTDADKGFVCTNDDGSDTVGTNALTFAQFSSSVVVGLSSGNAYDGARGSQLALTPVYIYLGRTPVEGVNFLDGTTVIGGSPLALDPATYARTGLTAAFHLVGTAFTDDNARTGTLTLWDITTDAAVATATFSNGVTPAAFTPAAATLNATPHVYELRLTCNGSLVSHIAYTNNVSLRVSWS